jgi:hypothetical protein
MKKTISLMLVMVFLFLGVISQAFGEEIMDQSPIILSADHDQDGFLTAIPNDMILVAAASCSSYTTETGCGQHFPRCCWFSSQSSSKGFCRRC